MEKRAIAITVGSIITMLLLAFLIWCTVLFWQNKAKKDTSYQEGYDAGLEDKSKLEIEITELKKDKSDLTVQLAEANNIITANNANIESLNSQKSELQTKVTSLTATNELNAQEITRLSTIKTENENKINELTAQNATQAETITQHTATIAKHEATISTLQASNTEYEAEIANLEAQLNLASTNKAELQEQIAGYKATIEQNKLQIADLQSTKTELQNRVNDLTASNNQYNATIVTQTAQIKEYNATIATNDATIQSLQTANEDCEKQITSLKLQLNSATTNKNELQQKITGYEATIEQNKLQIASLQATRTELETRISDLTESNTQKSATIATQNAQISEYVSTIASNDVTIQNLQEKNASAETKLSSLQTQLNIANASINELEQQITGYKATIEQNKLQIADLQATKIEMQSRIDDLTESNAQNSVTINTLQAHINSLSEQITQLTKTNNTNLATISQLNTQISSLTNRINELSSLNVEQSQKIADLNSQVVKLTNYIQQYEQFLTGLKSDTQAVATFEYDGALYALQLVTNGGYASVTTPTSTQYIVFGGWTVNNEIVDLSTYPITENTKFIASITYKYDVQFIADNDVVETQIVAKGSKPTAVTAPTKSGYRFLGWSKDGVNIVDPTTVAINGTTTFTALYIQQFSVRFLDDDNSTELKTQTLDKSAKATAPTVTTTDHKVFNGWKVGNAIVDVANYPITQNTDFVANYTYKYDVLFKNGDTTVSTQLITKNNCATAPTPPTKEGYKFLGWSINGTDIVAPATYTITANTTFTALWVQLHTVSFMRGDSVLDTQIIEHGKTATAPTVASTTYEVFNGWKLNGESVTPNTYTINANATFVADITYKYDVKFMNGDTAVSTQIITKNSYATLPDDPTKTGYEFDGWSLNGTDVVSNIATTKVTQNTTYKAVFTKLYTVKFVYENETKSTQSVRNGNSATAVTIDNTTYKIFNGWKVNNAIVNVASYKITQDTTFVADITYKYDVTFQVDDTTYDTQIVTSGANATAPTPPTKEGYKFLGWSINGIDIVAPATYTITANTTFIALWELDGYTVKFYSTNTNLVQKSSVAKNATIQSVPTVDTTVGDYTFVGWGFKDNDATLYTTEQLQELSITANTEFYAYYAKAYWGTFAYDSYSIVVKDDKIIDSGYTYDITYDYNGRYHDYSSKCYGSSDPYDSHLRGMGLEIYYITDSDCWIYAEYSPKASFQQFLSSYTYTRTSYLGIILD